MALTCFEMTSGDSGVNFEGSKSEIFGMASRSSSSSSSEPESLCDLCNVSSPAMIPFVAMRVLQKKSSLTH
jgi:hypothetical protein